MTLKVGASPSPLRSAHGSPSDLLQRVRNGRNGASRYPEVAHRAYKRSEASSA
jgi:hypothetical protein